MLTLPELRVLDMLKIQPDSREVFKKLCPPFREDDIDAAFRSLAAAGLIQEEMRTVWGKPNAYEGRMGFWKIVNKEKVVNK